MSKTTVEIPVGRPPKIPNFLCCNCGSDAKSLSNILTPLKVFNMIMTIEAAFSKGRRPCPVIDLDEYWAFPYCDSCRKTAPRIRTPMLIKLLQCFGTFVMFTFFFFVFKLTGFFLEINLNQFVYANWFWISVLCGVIIPALWYLSRWSKRGQSSYYQPVFVMRVKKELLFFGKPLSLLIAFCNEKYGAEFLKANKDDGDVTLCRQMMIGPERCSKK